MEGREIKSRQNLKVIDDILFIMNLGLVEACLVGASFSDPYRTETGRPATYDIGENV